MSNSRRTRRVAQPADLLRSMLRQRRLEEQVLAFAEAPESEIRGHFHVYIGQEATAAGVCAALASDDYLFTTHRNHAHVLAKGGDPGKILAEILGRSGGYGLGRAGTFHVAAPEVGVLHTSAIVGGCLPLAAGAAYANQLNTAPRASVACFGDGAMEEGVFYETLNIAQLWKVPVLFLMENNSVSPEERPGRGSPTSEHSARALSDVPKALSLDTRVIDGTDVDLVYRTASEIVPRLRQGEGPFFVEARTSRWPGSYGNVPRLLGGACEITWAWEPEAAPEPVRAWARQSDPVLLYARRLLEGGCSREDVLTLDREVREEIAAATRWALDSPPPEPAQALEHVYT
jgi:acetoin:2,6-dichlorophenolindophenol oxidoreductase subunit alpha